MTSQKSRLPSHSEFNEMIKLQLQFLSQCYQIESPLGELQDNICKAMYGMPGGYNELVDKWEARKAEVQANLELANSPEELVDCLPENIWLYMDLGGSLDTYLRADGLSTEELLNVASLDEDQVVELFSICASLCSKEIRSSFQASKFIIYHQEPECFINPKRLNVEEYDIPHLLTMGYPATENYTVERHKIESHKPSFILIKLERNRASSDNQGKLDV